MALPTAGLTKNLMIGTLFINFKNSGWSEKYILCGGDASPDSTNLTYEQAATNFGLIVAARALLLGLNCDIAWARVSAAVQKRESYPAISVHQPALEVTGDGGTIEKISDPEVCMNFRFDDGAGRFYTRSFRGLRDSWVTDFDTDGLAFSANPAHDAALETPTAPATLLTADQAIKNFLIRMKNLTLGVKLTGDPVNPWRTFAIPRSSFRRIKDRQTGRPFGMSAGKARTRV